MPRRLRIEYESAIYHVMARGNGRQDIARDDDDRQRLLVDLAREDVGVRPGFGQDVGVRPGFWFFPRGTSGGRRDPETGTDPNGVKPAKRKGS